MAAFLYRLGRTAFRRRWTTSMVWLLILIGVLFGAATAPPLPADTFTMPGTDTQQAFELLETKFPELNSAGAEARIVVRAPAGTTLAEPAQRDRVSALVADIRRAPLIDQVVDPYQAGSVSPDGRTGFVSAAFNVTATRMTAEAHTSLTQAAERARQSGLTVEMGGDAVPPSEGFGSGEVIGFLVAGVVLLITFGSLVAAGMPLLTAVLGVLISVAGIIGLGSTLGLSSTTSTLALMLGLAVGIDYALFIISRYRAEVTEGRERADAAGRAAGTAGSAVVFAGLTVVVALAGLAVVRIPLLTRMGLAGAGAVLIAVLVAVTLVPALLGFAPVKVLRRRDRARQYGRSPSARQQRKAEKRAGRTGPGASMRWARFVLRRPVLTLVVFVTGLVAIAVPATRLQLGLPSEGTMAPETTQRKAYDMLTESFGQGFNGPLTIVVSAPEATRVARTVSNDFKAQAGVVSVSDPVASTGDDAAVLTLVPSTGPTDKRTEDLVHRLRATGRETGARLDATVLVAGQTAMFLDFSGKLDAALLPYLGLVVGLAFILLMIIFRAVLVPLKAALGFLLSVTAALGAVVAVFQWGWLAAVFGVEQPGPIMSTMPILLIGVVFGLAMDYEVFLVARMREAYAHGQDAREAVVTGFRYGGSVVTAAALIMMSVFSGFIVQDNDFIQMIGLGLAAAVLFDAFAVRMAIIPALFALLGEAAWWMPRWLGRVLPRVDIEGTRLDERHEAHAEVPSSADASSRA
jgi:putative drug exporter of the RND superfamily